MPLIRPANSDRIARPALVLDLGDLRKHGEKLVEQSRVKAAAIAQEAIAERERLIAGASEKGLEEGRAKGYADGLERGRAEGHAAVLNESRSQLERVTHAWSVALGEFESARAGIVAAAKEDVLALALDLAAKITKRAIDAEPKIVQAQLEAALAVVMQPTRLRVRMNPVDVTATREVMPALMKRFGLGTDAELIEDAALERGSAVILTDRGEIDASIETQFDRLVEALLPDRHSRAAATATEQPATLQESPE